MARRKNHLLGSIALLAAGMVVGWWLARQSLPLLQPATQGTDAPAAGDIRRIDFQNFNYSVSCVSEDGRSFEIQVRDGEYSRRQQFDALFFSVLSVDYGDLTGDGADEAVIATNCNTGGTGQFSEGLVYTLRNGKPVLMARVDGGDRAFGGIAGMSVEDGRLLVERYATDDDGPACCPRYIETVQLRWDGSRFVEAGGATRRRLPDDGS